MKKTVETIRKHIHNRVSKTLEKSKKITKKEAKELEKIRNEYRGYDEVESRYTIQSPIIDYLLEEHLEDI